MSGGLGEDRFMLSWRVPALRNTATAWVAGAGSTSSGFLFPDQVQIEELVVSAEITLAEASKTFAVTVYKDDVTASDDVFAVSTSIAALAKVRLTDTSTGTKDGSFGTGSELNIKLTTDGSACQVDNITVTLYCRWL